MPRATAYHFAVTISHYSRQTKSRCIRISFGNETHNRVANPSAERERAPNEQSYKEESELVDPVRTRTIYRVNLRTSKALSKPL
jgi:hypothetical protein